MNEQEHDAFARLLAWAAARLPERPVDRARVPPHLHPLLPLVDWLGGDSPDHHEEVALAFSFREWELLYRLDDRWDDPVHDWLAGPGGEENPVSDAYMQLAHFGMLLDDARTRVNRRAREAAGEPPPPPPRPDLGGPRRGGG